MNVPPELQINDVIISSPPALLLPSGVRSPDPIAPAACPDPDLNQTGCNTSVQEAARTMTPPAGGAYNC